MNTVLPGNMEVTWFPVSCEDLLFSSVQICFTAAAQNASVPPAGLEGVLAFTPLNHQCLPTASQREAAFGTNRYTLSLAALSHDYQGSVSITGVRLPQAIQTARVAVTLKQPGHEPNTPLHQ